MMANGSSLSEVLNDLCASIDAHALPLTSMICLRDGEWLSPCTGPHIPATLKAAMTPWPIGLRVFSRAFEADRRIAAPS
jgi:hypothetical protein